MFIKTWYSRHGFTLISLLAPAITFACIDAAIALFAGANVTALLVTWITGRRNALTKFRTQTCIHAAVVLLYARNQATLVNIS